MYCVYSLSNIFTSTKDKGTSSIVGDLQAFLQVDGTCTQGGGGGVFFFNVSDPDLKPRSLDRIRYTKMLVSEQITETV